MQGLQGGIARRVAIKGVFLAIALGLMASLSWPGRSK